MMKKVMFTLCALLILQGNTFAANDKLITIEQLPKAARTFIKQHFSEKQVAQTSMDNDLFAKDYTVIFADGTKVDFDTKGVWSDVDCRQQAVPKAIIPSKIQAYLTASYPTHKVVKIDREDKGGYEVKLSNDFALKFNSSQVFLGIDD